MSITDTQCAFEAGRGFGKTASSYRMLTGHPLRMSKIAATYGITSRGVVVRRDPWETRLPKFVPPYVPVKASRVYPALKTCTSPRRAAIARQRALFAAAIGTPEQARASGFQWYEADIKPSQVSFTDKALFGEARLDLGDHARRERIMRATIKDARPRGF